MKLFELLGYSMHLFELLVKMRHAGIFNDLMTFIQLSLTTLTLTLA